VEVDINQLPLRERNKILNQRVRDAKKAEEKVEKDAEKAKKKENKEAKKAEKSGKSKVSTPPLLLTETSYASPSQNPCKRDASTAQLSLSRLQ
jgi:lipid II:glycine glycyltransferase (peptidoglycan interpeptide bridge formation enzyme)